MPPSKKKLILYQKPTCTTCRQALKIVEASSCDVTTVNYYEQPFTKAGLAALLRKAGLNPRDALRTKEERYRQLGLAHKELSDDQLIELMIQHPDLIQRPIVDAGDVAILARPAERVTDLLK